MHKVFNPLLYYSIGKMSINAVTRRMRLVDLLISLGIMVLAVVGTLGNLTDFNIGSVLLNAYELYYF